MQLWWSCLAILAQTLAAHSDAVHDDFVLQAKNNNGLLKLDSKSFQKLTAPDREWSVTIQLTALGSSFKCAPCKTFDPSFVTIAKAWSKAPAGERDQHFFGTLDFENGSDIFRQMGINAAPLVYTYPAAKGDRRPANGKLDPVLYDFGSDGFDAASFADGINRHMPIKIPYSKPTDWTPLIGIAIFIVFAAIGAPFVIPALTNKWLWAIISVGTSLVMTSGFMFVRIRGNPYVAGNGGQSQWIAPGYQNQYGMETQVVAFIYGMLSFSCLALVLFIPRIPSRTKQSIAIYIWSGVGITVFAVLLSFFRIKNPSYPFRFFL